MIGTTTAAAAEGITLGRPAPAAFPASSGVTDSHLPPGVCDHWSAAESRYCRAAAGVRRYRPGYRCPAHTPSALQGKPEPAAGPGWPIHRQEAQA